MKRRFDAFHMTAIAMTRVGHAEIHPPPSLTDASQAAQS
jgi:hypothetical protein